MRVSSKRSITFDVVSGGEVTKIWIQNDLAGYKCREYLIIRIQNDFKDRVPQNAPFAKNKNMSIPQLGISQLRESLKPKNLFWHKE